MAHFVVYQVFICIYIYLFREVKLNMVNQVQYAPATKSTDVTNKSVEDRNGEGGMAGCMEN